MEYNHHKKEIHGGAHETTNNRMEMTAAIEALASLKQPSTVRLHTDSTYLKDGVTKWITNWKLNGWKTAAKKPVKNQDLWLALDKVLGKHNIEWFWVKGHAGHPGNERADELANLGMAEYK